MLSSLNLPKTIPVGNSDAGSYFNNKVMLAIDYGVCTFLVHDSPCLYLPVAVKCPRLVRQHNH